jgi:hypothetical protein
MPVTVGKPTGIYVLSFTNNTVKLMKKGLPRFTLLTDPFGSLPERILILRAESPRYIFEINHPDDTENVQEVTVGDQTYRVAIRRKLTDDQDIALSFFRDVARWYHYSKQENSKADD